MFLCREHACPLETIFDCSNNIHDYFPPDTVFFVIHKDIYISDINLSLSIQGLYLDKSCESCMIKLNKVA